MLWTIFGLDAHKDLPNKVRRRDLDNFWKKVSTDSNDRSSRSD